MFTLCANNNCVRAGWCKRCTYISKIPVEERKFWTAQYFTCSKEDNWAKYCPNVARTIYERENPDDRFVDEQPEQEEHGNNNRQSGVREDDNIDTENREPGSEGDSPERDSVLQLFERSDSGGQEPSTFDFTGYLYHFLEDHHTQIGSDLF